MSLRSRANQINAVIAEFDVEGIVCNTNKLPKGLKQKMMDRYYELYKQQLGLNTIDHYIRSYRLENRKLPTSDQSNQTESTIDSTN
jgi:hypothetical protein